jgi:membrane associated rhomboid family serine protease
MSILSDLFLGMVLPFAISTVLVFYFLNSENGADTWWKVNPEVDLISTWGMYFFFIGLSFVISIAVFDVPARWGLLKTGLEASLVATLVGLIVFVIGKYTSRKRRADKAESRNPP